MPNKSMTEPERLEEDRALKVGYAAMLQQRHPFQPEEEPSYNEENAYILALEKEYLEIPERLEFRNLIDFIPQKHHERLAKIWDAVKEHYSQFHQLASDLKAKWTEEVPVDLLDDNSAQVIQASPMKIRTDLANGVRAIISDPTHKELLGRWRRAEKSLRVQLHNEDQMFMIALRLYYEMLLETSNPDHRTGKKEYVLPKDHPLREEVAVRNNYLRIIDAEHQGAGISKAAHHAQKTARMRETEKKPATVHESDVTHAAILDVVPFILDRDATIDTYTQDGTDMQVHTIHQSMSELSIILAMVGQIHDISEDTELSLQDLMSNYVVERTDFYDSSLDQLIESGFKVEDPQRTRENIKKRVLNLIKDRTLRVVMQLMRILSNNTELNEQEKKRVIERCGANPLILRILEVEYQELTRWNPKVTDPEDLPHTFEKFPDEEKDDRGKTTKFLIRLNALATSPERQRDALIFKLEDRANSLITLAPFRPEKQRRILRTTTSRIIAWAMLDHNNEKYPLYNALPRVIDCAVQAYENLHRKHPEIIKPLDGEYMAELKEWQAKVRRFKLPEKIQAVMDAHRDLVRERALQAIRAIQPSEATG